MKILNLTQHPATPEQIQAGVIDLPEEERQSLQRLLTFDTLPGVTKICVRAVSIAAMAEGKAGEYVCAMIGGAPYLMAPLERALRNVGVYPVYAFSVRESIEQIAPDGSVLKTNKFCHVGFVPAV
jgi:hypothetical protein